MCRAKATKVAKKNILPLGLLRGRRAMILCISSNGHTAADWDDEASKILYTFFARPQIMRVLTDSDSRAQPAASAARRVPDEFSARY